MRRNHEGQRNRFVRSGRGRPRPGYAHIWRQRTALRSAAPAAAGAAGAGRISSSRGTISTAYQAAGPAPQTDRPGLSAAVISGRSAVCPVLRLAPVRAAGNNCPFLTEGRCAVHQGPASGLRPLPAGDRRSAPKGRCPYYFQGTRCGGTVREGTLAAYLEGSGDRPAGAAGTFCGPAGAWSWSGRPPDGRNCSSQWCCGGSRQKSARRSTTRYDLKRPLAAAV